MNIIGVLLNYLEISKFLVILMIILIISVTYLLLRFESSLVSYLQENYSKIVYTIKKEDAPKKVEEEKKCLNQRKEEKIIEIKGYYQNKINENEKKFFLSDKTENIENLSQKILETKNDNISKSEDLSIMFIESLSSLNSWKNNEIENQFSKNINWNLEKRENGKDGEESLVYQYIFPQPKLKDNISHITISNFSSSQSSVNSNYNTDDEEEEKAFFSSYKLGICRIFDYSEENKLKSNIVKEINGKYFKVYSQGNPDLIKEKCRKETIPDNYNEMVDKFKKDGYNIIGISGKKMKMNYIQSQRVDRTKCESNMTFLGLAVYKSIYDGYKYAYS
jgi:hypothetical protein